MFIHRSENFKENTKKIIIKNYIQSNSVSIKVEVTGHLRRVCSVNLNII